MESTNYDWNRYKKVCITFLRRHERKQARYRENLRTSAPREYWLEMSPQNISQYDGKWSPEELAEYFSTVNQDRFTPPNEILESTKARIAFAEDWRKDFKDEALQTCWDSIEKVDFKNALGGALGKAAGIDGQKAATGRLAEQATAGITKDRAHLLFQANYQRDSWRHDKAIVLLKPGKNDEGRKNLRRINVIVAQAKEIEAILGDIVEREGRQDRYQGGYTAGMEVAGRAFIACTAICWRLRIYKICTYTCFVDRSAFFHTIIPELVADQLIE